MDEQTLLLIMDDENWLSFKALYNIICVSLQSCVVVA